MLTSETTGPDPAAAKPSGHAKEGGQEYDPYRDGDGPQDRDEDRDEDREALRPPRSRRPAVVAGLLAAALAAGGTWAITSGSAGEDTPVTADKSLASTPVKRTDLVQTGSFDGTLSYANSRTINASGQGVVTALPAAGRTIKQGQALYHVDAAGTYLMYGVTPMYRALSDGAADGADIKQLERALKTLGHDPDGMSVDGAWTDATTDAVNDWKDSLGWEEDGRVTPQQVQFAPGPLRVQSVTASVGQAVSPNSSLYTVSDTGRTVTVPLSTADAAIARVGDTVTIQLPTGSSVGGKVTAIGTAATAPASEGSGNGASANGGATNAGGASAGTTDATVDVTITVNDPAKAGTLATAPVTVVFTQDRAQDVLAVPVTALLALQGGGFAVEVDDGAGRTHLVPVTPGLYAASGLVEVSGAGITAGTRVLVPSGS
jgi:hypothetical protein